MHAATIYTDGACSGNGTARARGGWAAILALEGSDMDPGEFSGAELGATNQRMEIAAVIGGLSALRRPCKVTVVCDSAYVVGCMQQGWHVGWRENGWKNTSRKPIANRDLWEKLLVLVEESGHDVDFRKVPGHADKLRRISTADEIFNQRCDALAVEAAARI
jgi:ribonuclease HI